MSGTPFTSPVMRLVQGGVTLKAKKDQRTGQPKLDKEGNPIYVVFLAGAIAKTDPQLGEFYAIYQQVARACFPWIFTNADGSPNRKFAMKVKDGDGVDDNGQSVANKPGFAGHWIFSMETMFAPRCFHYGKYDPSQQIQPEIDAQGRIIKTLDDIIKKGYFIRVSGTIDGNGVGQTDNANKPGLFVSPSMIELVGYGPEITTGPDASTVFGAQPITHMPAGMSQTPILTPVSHQAPPALPGAAPAGLTPPALPGLAQPAPAALPGMQQPAALPGMQQPAGLPGLAPLPVNTFPNLQPAAQPTGLPPGFPAPPGAGIAPAVAQPVYQMTAAAQGATREQLNAHGWNDEALIAGGYMVRVA